MKNNVLKCATFPSGPIETNMYLAYSSDGDAALIDPVDLTDALLEFIGKLNLKIGAMLITHTHVDHMHAAALAVERFGVPLYMHGAAEKMREFYEDSCEMLDFPKNSIPKAYIACDKMEKISFGGAELSVITSPGHSPCGLMFYCENFLISGDTLFKGSIGRYDLLLASLPLLYQSLKKLNAFPDDLTVYPGHGPSTTLGYERKNNPYFAFSTKK
jgi:glyoxylase-like metal-dependent hydrolase (beta-lactamase superfamily II)